MPKGLGPSEWQCLRSEQGLSRWHDAKIHGPGNWGDSKYRPVKSEETQRLDDKDSEKRKNFKKTKGGRGGGETVRRAGCS